MHPSLRLLNARKPLITFIGKRTWPSSKPSNSSLTNLTHSCIRKHKGSTHIQQLRQNSKKPFRIFSRNLMPRLLVYLMVEERQAREEARKRSESSGKRLLDFGDPGLGSWKMERSMLFWYVEDICVELDCESALMHLWLYRVGVLHYIDSWTVHAPK